MPDTVPTICRMCNDQCGLTASVAGGRVVAVKGTPGHPWNDGKLCGKGQDALEIVNAPDRLTRPLKRVGSQWVEIDLATALDEIAEKLEVLKQTYGARSVAVWKGEGVGFAQQEMLARRFCHAWGTPNYFSNDSTCFCSRWIASSLVYGTGLVPDYEHARCITLWGANPANSHPFHFAKIKSARKAGARLIVIDPRNSEVVRSADLHLKPRLGTDGALAWGLMRVLINENLVDREFVQGYTLGFDELAAYAQAFTPEAVERETGVPAAQLIEAARLMAVAAPSSLIYAGNGLEHHVRGTENLRSIACIGALLGSIDRAGGSRWPDSFPLASLTLYQENPLDDLNPIGAAEYPLLYQFNQECHTLTGIDAMLTGQPYPVRGLLLTAANPVLSNPRSDKVQQAFTGLDLLVVRDLFLTETARLAHYVLPAASFLERTELHVDSTHNRVHLTKAAISRPETQDELAFWRSLAQRLGVGDQFPWENETALNHWLLQDTGVKPEDISVDPTGYSFAPLSYEKWRDRPFPTQSGRIEFASPSLADHGLPRLPEYPLGNGGLKVDPLFPYHLISGNRQKNYVGSRYQNRSSPGTAAKGPFATINAADARDLGINSGDLVTVTSRTGSLTLACRVADDADPGIVQIPFGWAQANVNLLTPDDRNDPVTGFPSMKEVPVQIAPEGN
jgi:anaerobic selenocysteine-containing dehydrogenase